MRYYTSVWNLLVRRSFWRVLLILLLLIGANFYAFLCIEPSRPYLDEFPLDAPSFRYILFFGLTAMMAVVSIPGCSFRTYNEYTLMRLGISERMIFFLQAGFNACCFVLLWLTQALCLCVFELLVNGFPGFSKDAADYVRYYDSQLFHSLLPLKDGFRMSRNIALVAGLGLLTAAAPFWQRRRKFAVSLVPMFIVSNLNFAHEIVDYFVGLFGYIWDIGVIGFVTLVMTGVLIGVFCEEKE